MAAPPSPQLMLLISLGGVFPYFLLAGARTFHSPSGEKEPGRPRAQAAFLVGGTMPVWFLGFHQPIHLPNGIVAAVLLVLSVALYEWARHTVRGRHFGLGWGDHVPPELCEIGPYRIVRHPIYLSYLLAFLAAAVALPHWLTASSVVANVALFTHAARCDERTLAASALAAQYAAYRARAGMFWPRLSRPAPGR